MRKRILIFLILCLIKFLKWLVKDLKGHHIELLNMTLSHIRVELIMLKGDKE